MNCNFRYFIGVIAIRHASEKRKIQEERLR